MKAILDYFMNASIFGFITGIAIAVIITAALVRIVYEIISGK